MNNYTISFIILLTGIIISGVLFLTAEAYQTRQLDLTITYPQNHVTMWDDYTVRLRSNGDTAEIKIRGITDPEYGYFEGKIRDGFLAAPFLIRDFEYRTDTFYNVSVTVHWNDQTKTKYTGFWVHIQGANR